MNVCSKQLRETFNRLRLINKKNRVKNGLTALLQENIEPVAILVTGMATAQRNHRRGDKRCM